MKDIDYMEIAEEAMERIKSGAFLTVKTGNNLNTMTIGWALIGYVWRKPVFMVAVRDSRHTFGIMEKAEDFTVTVPESDMKDAIMFCGTKSGRDHDKLKELNLETVPAKSVISPVIKTKGIHFECRIVFKAPMDRNNLIAEYEKLYPEKDYHTLYFGEILKCYRLD